MLSSRAATVLLRPIVIIGFMNSNSENLSYPSTEYLDPRREPCQWLGVVLTDLLEQDTEESREALKWAFPRLALWLEPGLVDQLFQPWIEDYIKILEEKENKT